MSHYYTADDSEHDYGEVDFNFRGETFKFKTDRGVFSRGRIDYGTRVLLEGVVRDAGSGDFHFKRMVDMGAGYGPVGIVLGRLLDVEPVMVEVNEDAVALVKDNLGPNHSEAVVMSRESYDSCEDIYCELYVTNPPFRAGKQIVMDIIEDAHGRLTGAGLFYMVVQKKQGMPSYKKAVEKVFGHVEVVMKDKGYHVLKARK